MHAGAGFITSAAESGAAVLRIADQSRHKSLDVLRCYVRRATAGGAEAVYEIVLRALRETNTRDYPALNDPWF